MDNDLQFDRAEFATPRATACSACQTALTTEYFAINGRVFCARCAEGVRQHFGGAGSGAGRFAKALLLGVGAAVAGGAVYAAVMITSRSEWALISIGIGWLVGKAVRKGSGNRGGWRYQLLACLLTYSAIAGAYAADALHLTGLRSAAHVVGVAIMGYAVPFLAGTQNIIGILIIGFGLLQAWQMNRPVKLEITGPHAIGGAAPTTGV